MTKFWSAFTSIAALGLGLGFGAAGCDSQQDAQLNSVAQTEGRIVGGTPETGFPAIGALVVHGPQIGYYGSFCSGTLIHPQWVLTAAHCLTGEGGFANFIEPKNVSFFMGSVANTNSPSKLPQGTLAPSQAFYIHPNYKGDSNQDIALIQLKTPVTSVEPISIYAGPFGGAFVGNVITYVGFGVNNGSSQSGGGIKRLGTMKIAWMESLIYGSVFEGQGVCFGDSGGPGIREFDGVWRVIGVNSAVLGGQAGVPCQEYAVHTRVDKYTAWIESTIANPPPIVGCLADKEFCSCDAACQPDGSCDEAACPTPGSCEALYQCVSGCNTQACSQGCYGQATPAAQSDFNAMAVCLNDNCAGSGSQQEYQQCAYSKCGNQITSCLQPEGPKEGTNCQQTYQCVLGCSTQSCAQTCYQGASLDGQVKLQAMLACYELYCNDSQTQLQFQQCAVANCTPEIDACFAPPPPASCDPVEGTCGSGETCVPTRGGTSACVPTAGLESGEACDGTGESGVECGPGLTCVPAGIGKFECAPYCDPNAPCPAEQLCVPGPAGWPAGVGTCVCIDADGDGVCATEDCDDDDSGSSPLNAETCGDGVDNNCDGLIDEDCISAPEEAPSESEEIAGSDNSNQGAPIGAPSLLPEGPAADVGEGSSGGGCRQQTGRSGMGWLWIAFVGAAFVLPRRRPQ